MRDAEQSSQVRVLVLGAGGMLGHKVWQVCRDRFDSWAAVRSTPAKLAPYALFHPDRLLGGVDAGDFDTVVRTVELVRPQVVINAIGVVKQRMASQDVAASLAVNAVFPHQLGKLCEGTCARLIHISTDCVFAGRGEMYTETDRPDPEDLYGRSKLMGEVQGSRCLVLRTSVVGREVRTSYGLVEWFLGQRGGRVRGYTNAIFSGLSTLVFAHLVAELIERHPTLVGLYHVSADVISKYELLCLLRDAYHVSTSVDPFAEVRVNRSLDSSRFRAATGFAPPSWSSMVKEMAADPTPYEEWRRAYAS